MRRPSRRGGRQQTSDILLVQNSARPHNLLMDVNGHVGCIVTSAVGSAGIGEQREEGLQCGIAKQTWRLTSIDSGSAGSAKNATTKMRNPMRGGWHVVTTTIFVVEMLVPAGIV